MLAKNSYLDSIREKRAFSLISNKISTRSNENSNLALKTEKSKENCKFPCIITSHKAIDPNEKSPKFYMPNSQYFSNSQSRQKTDESHEFLLKKSLNLKNSLKIIQSYETANLGKKFHFLAEKETAESDRLKTENLAESALLSKHLKEKNKYLSYLEICNKDLLDFDYKNTSTKKLSNFLNENHHMNNTNASLLKKNHVFLTNFEDNPHKTEKKKMFQLNNMIKDEEKCGLFIEDQTLARIKLKRKIFSFKKSEKNNLQKKFNEKIQLFSIEQIKEKNQKNQENEQYKKIKSLMGFAEIMKKIVNDQKNKIDFLLQNVSDKFEEVVKNS